MHGMNKHIANNNGNKIYQQKWINKSNFNLGNEALTHTNVNIKKLALMIVNDEKYNESKK